MRSRYIRKDCFLSWGFIPTPQRRERDERQWWGECHEMWPLLVDRPSKTALRNLMILYNPMKEQNFVSRIWVIIQVLWIGVKERGELCAAIAIVAYQVAILLPATQDESLQRNPKIQYLFQHKAHRSLEFHKCGWKWRENGVTPGPHKGISKHCTHLTVSQFNPIDVTIKIGPHVDTKHLGHWSSVNWGERGGRDAYGHRHCDLTGGHSAFIHARRKSLTESQ